MKKSRVSSLCKVCSLAFETRPCEVGVLVTCSRVCSLAYRALNASMRPPEFFVRMGAASRGAKRDTSFITDEYRNKKREIAIANMLGKANLGKKLSQEHRMKMSAAHLGHSRSGWKLSDKIKAEMSLRFKGENSTFWRGGLTEAHKLERSSYLYKEWRNTVFARDNYTCQICDRRGVEINADHIKPFALFPGLRYSVENGRTLCVACHRKTDTYGRGTVRLKTTLGLDVRVVK